ncbi:vUbi [Symbiodinium sp. CCMP2592]|nr:vUbi [Symbiodinium sp. CCMP2592]
MRILVRDLAGRTYEVTASQNIRVGPLPPQQFRPERFVTAGSVGISEAKILGDAASVVARAAAQELVRFWESPDGQAIREYLQKEAGGLLGDSDEESVDERERSWEPLSLTASLDELIVEFSRFFVLKAINSDTAAPRVATETEPPSKRLCTTPSSQLSPSFHVDEVWHRLLLFPRAYQTLCRSLTGEVIDHDPRSKDQHQPDRYHVTFTKYLKLFGKAPPFQFWDIPTSWHDDPELCLTNYIDENEETLKKIIERKRGIPVDQQRLIFGGFQLEDHKSLSECGVRDGSTIDIVLRLRGC